MGVIDGQAVSAAVTNPAFLDANGDDTATGKISFADVDPVSGATVTNVQREVNSLDSFTGRASGSAHNATPGWVNNDVGTSGDNLEQRSDALTAKFNSSTGHKHTGAAGDAPPITGADLASVPYRGYVQQGIDQVGVTGTSTDISTDMIGYSPSAGPTSLGVVVNAPQNQIVLRHATGASEGDAFYDGSGNLVYGRLTESTGVWTLSYYVNLSGTETAYTFSSSDVRWYFQQIFNPMINPPVYSEFAIIPSDNTTADVITATTALQGKTMLASAAASEVGSSSGAGTANATVANADHSHKGVHSVDGGTADLFGDISIAGSGGSAVTQAGQTITVTSPALSSTTPAEVGSAGAIGSGTTSAKADHVHKGVHKVTDGVNDAYGDLTVVGSGGATASISGSTLTINASGAGTPLSSSPPNDVAGTDAAGSSSSASRGDHTHRGVTSVNKSGDTTLYGAVTITGSGTVTITQTGQNIDIGATGGGGSFISPLTNKGDILGYDTSDARLPVGTDGKILVADSSNINGMGISWSGPRGVYGLQWIEDVNSALSGIEYNNKVYLFQSGGGQDLYALFKVPDTYNVGNVITMRGKIYTPDSSGTGLISTQTTLFGNTTDISTSTNQYTSTNSAVTFTVSNVPKSIVWNLTDSLGKINSVAVAVGDLIKIRLFRNTDSATSDIRVLVNAIEVTYV